MTFEEAFIAMVAELSGIPLGQFAWGQAPLGQPAAGVPQIVFRNAPGGERELTQSGVSTEMSRMIEVQLFAQNYVPDLTTAASALHGLEGFQGILADGTTVWAIVPGMQDVDGFDNDEKLEQKSFSWQVRMSTSPTPIDYSGSIFDGQFGSLSGKTLDGGTV